MSAENWNGMLDQMLPGIVMKKAVRQLERDIAWKDRRQHLGEVRSCDV